MLFNREIPLPRVPASNSPAFVVRFGHSEEGRPHVYDFFWEHVTPFFKNVGEKNVHIRMELDAPLALWHRALSSPKKEWDGLLWKFLEDKRFKHRVNAKATSPVLEIDVPIAQLDAMLNAHNIFFDRVFPHIEMHGTHARVDFSLATQNEVRVHISPNLQKKCTAFLEKQLSPIEISPLSGRRI